MKKMSKIMTAMSIIGMAGIGAYMYMNMNKCDYKKYMNYIMK